MGRLSTATSTPPRHHGRVARFVALATLLVVTSGGPGEAAAQRPSLAAATMRYVEVDEPVVAIVGVRLVDGTGAPARDDVTVVIRDDRIAAVGATASVEVPEGARIVEGAGRTLMPGFVMLHEHLFYVAGGGRYNTQHVSFPRLYLAGGATTIRTTGSMEPYTDLKVRDMIDAGAMAGPRIDVTGPYVEGVGLPIPGIHGLEDAEDARAFVAYWADEGVTSFKVYNLLTRDMLAATLEEAHARGLKVTGHLCSITYREAAESGIDNLEHGFLAATDFVEGKRPDRCPAGGNTASLLDVDLEGPAFAGLVEHLVEHDVTITSTLPVFETFTPGRPPAPAGALDALLPETRDQYLRRRASIAVQESSPWARLFPKGMAMEKAFHDAGGRLVVGTDPTGYGGVVAGYANIRAVELLVEAGLSFEEAVRVATLNGAEYLERADDLGSVEVGKLADLVLVEGDPTARTADLRDIVLVFKDGYGYDSPALFGSVKGTVGLR